MLMAVREWLTAQGFTSDLELARWTDASPDAVLIVAGSPADHEVHHFAIEYRGRGPRPSELPLLEHRRQALAKAGVPLLAAPYISEAVGESLVSAGWCWADEAGNCRLTDLPLAVASRVRHSVASRDQKWPTFPRGPGGLAVVRTLIAQAPPGTGLDQAAIAQSARVTQGRVSQVLSRLTASESSAGDYVFRSPSGFWAGDQLLETFLAAYRGAGGTERYYYCLDPPASVAVAIQNLTPPTVDLRISADVGPDLITPLRSPTSLIVYTEAGLSVPADRFVATAAQDEANVILIVPADKSVFLARRLEASFGAAELQLADPVQMIWDLHRLGGEDRVEQAEELARWLVEHR